MKADSLLDFLVSEIDNPTLNVTWRKLYFVFVEICIGCPPDKLPAFQAHQSVAVFGHYPAITDAHNIAIVQYLYR